MQLVRVLLFEMRSMLHWTLFMETVYLQQYFIHVNFKCYAKNVPVILESIKASSPQGAKIKFIRFAKGAQPLPVSNIATKMYTLSYLWRLYNPLTKRFYWGSGA